ncbi:hypothetical protein D1223_02395 [Henriciella mobilis]|uniref:Enoyl-CoA hydratase n=2 Tax=Henriciella mobilis TaxID=2305467 RepID=A0A399RPH1_9PROT|nr:hypothetical protein D1223_02395 [Henriciella mobilis]
MEKPLICAVNGPAAGAGLGLALMGDLVIMADTATLTTAYAKIGLSPDGGVSWLLPRLVGLRVAQELLVSSRIVSAEEAREIGMITEVVPAAELKERVREAAIALRDASPRALGAVRALLLSSFSTTLETQLELEVRAISPLTISPDAKRLSANFAAKRTRKS